MTSQGRHGASPYRRLYRLSNGLCQFCESSIWLCPYLITQLTCCVKIVMLLLYKISSGRNYDMSSTINNTKYMMTSSNGSIFPVIGSLCGEFTGHRWVPITEASDIFSVAGPLWGESTGHRCCKALIFSLMYAWTNGWANSPDAGDLRRLSTHCDFTVMKHTDRALLCFLRFDVAEFNQILSRGTGATVPQYKRGNSEENGCTNHIHTLRTTI